MVFWFSVGPWLKDPLNFGDFANWIIPVFMLSFVISLLSLSFVLIEDYYFKLILSFLSSLPVVLVFGFDNLYILGVVLIFLFNFSSIKKIKHEMAENIKVRLTHTIKKGLPSLITPILISLSFVYFLSPTAQNLADNKSLPPVISNAVKSVSLQLINNDIANIPTSQKNQAIDKATSEVMTRLNNFYRQYSDVVPPLLAFGLFLVLKGLSFVFIWLAIALSLAIFKILRKFNIVSIQPKEIIGEKLVFNP